jgi:cobalamin synthase
MSFEEKEKRTARSGDIMEQPVTRITGAVVLIGLGIFFLLSQSGVLSLQGNWWAIFIALPALSMLYTAYKRYQQDGHVSAEVMNGLSGAIIVGLVAILAAINQWQLLLPLILIVIGVFVFFGGRRSSRRHQN